MKVETALDAGFLRLRGFEAAVTRIDVTFENDFGVGQAPYASTVRALTRRIGAPCTAPAMPTSSQPCGRMT